MNISLGASAKFRISVSENVKYHLQRQKLQPQHTGEKTIWYTDGQWKIDIYWLDNFIRQFKNKISKKNIFFEKQSLSADSRYYNLGCIHRFENPVLVNKKIFNQEKQRNLNKHIFENA